MDESQAGGILGGPWTWGLIVLGLPWSWPLYLVSMVLSYSVGDFASAPVYFLAPTLVALSVIANIVLMSLLVWHPTCRTALTSWFFRLNSTAAPVVETPPPAA